ncbi:MAG: hypothetical protein AAF636_18445 [Pseudomonadota bacterium]
MKHNGASDFTDTASDIRRLPASSTLYSIENSLLDAFEMGLLSIARHFFATSDTPALQAWRHAYGFAVDEWGETLGLAAAYKLQKVISAIMSARQDKFDYLDPFMPESHHSLTSDEVNLMLMLHYMRREETRLARDAAEKVCLGYCDPHVVRTGLSLAFRFSLGAEKSKRPGQQAGLFVVP